MFERDVDVEPGGADFGPIARLAADPFGCVECGGEVEAHLERLGSIRCQDCRDGLGVNHHSDVLRRAA